MKQIINYSRFKVAYLLFALVFVGVITSCNDDDEPVSDIVRVSMKTQPKLKYVLGSALDLSEMVITVDKGGDLVDIPYSSFDEEGITTEPINGKILDFSDKSVTITLGDTGKGLIQAISVTNDVIVMEIKTEPTTDYFYGQNLDLTGMVLTFTYENGDKNDFTYSEVQKEIETVPANGDVLSSDTDVTITNIDSGVQVVQELKIATFFPRSAMLVTGPTKNSYTVGEKLDLTGTVIRYTLIDKSEVEIGFEDFEALRINANPANGTILNAGVTTVKVKHILPTTQVSIPITVTP